MIRFTLEDHQLITAAASKTPAYCILSPYSNY